MVLDMMCVLVHGSLIPESSDKTEENTKAYMQLIKKLRVSYMYTQTDKEV